MKRHILILFALLSVNSIYAQYQGDDYLYYDAHDVDKLLAIKAANPQSNLNWEGNNYSSWNYCSWEQDSNNLKHLVHLGDKNIFPSFGSHNLKMLDVSGCSSLQHLDCNDNQLTSLNVSGCSNLQGLYCSSNQLTSFDVSGCSSLQMLYCSNNQLTSLNVSGCSSLQRLSCSNNQFTSLNVSGCSGLQSLECSRNQLTSLNVNGCSSLQYLDCSSNQFTSLDVSGCSGLQSLTCSSNQFTSLNVSGCSGLQSLDCSWNQLTSLNVSGCSSLQYLNCSINQLTSLDVSGCPSLQSLDCPYNQLTSLNVSGCSGLQGLECSRNQLTSLNVNGCSSLQSLYCTVNQLTSLDVSGCSSLQSLECSSNQLTSLNVSGCSGLQSLGCYSNQLISLNVSGYSSLQNLECYSNQLTSLDVSKCSSLQELTCYSNQLTFLDVRGCSKLEQLLCYNNRLTDENLPVFYGLNIRPDSDGWTGIKRYKFDLQGNKGFTESAIRKLADNLPYIEYEQILYDKLPEKGNYSVELLSLDDKPMIGVAADGTAQLKIRLKYSSQNPDIKGKIKINIFSDDTKYDDSESGVLMESNTQELLIENKFIYENGESYQDFIYTAPDDYCRLNNDDESQSRLVKINIKDFINENEFEEIVNGNAYIEIIRPPVLFVHGLNGDKKTFAQMEKSLRLSNYSQYQLYNLDYSYSNTASFATNTPLVLFALNTLFNNVRQNGFEVKRADIVAHGMGGLLTRQYLQSDIYSDNINRLITLNTPHSGSQGTNLIMDMGGVLDAAPYITFLPSPAAWNLMNSIDAKEEIDRFVKEGAVRDLCVDSEAISFLNGSSLNKKIIPSHAVYTTYNAPVSVSNLLLFEGLIEVSKIALDLTTENVYNKEPNDLVVAESSQIGGVNANATSFIPNQWHSSTENPQMIARIQWLLNQPAQNQSLFSVQGYHPPKLVWSKVNQSKSKNASVASEIKISSIDKPQCTNNEDIKIRLTGSNILKMSLMIQGEGENIYMETKEGSSNEFFYTVPEEAIGYKKILAIGYTDSQTTVTDTASFIVSTSASLLGINIDENELWVPLYGKQQVLVQGLFSDGTSKNITYLNDVQYEIKGNNASLESPNIVIGKIEGTDTLVVTYKGLTTHLPIKIVDIGLEENTAINSPDLFGTSPKLMCYPNPANNIVNINYELTQGGNPIISIYNNTGQIVKEVALDKKDVGSHKETIGISNLPPGLYIVVLDNGDFKYSTKLIKLNNR